MDIHHCVLNSAFGMPRLAHALRVIQGSVTTFKFSVRLHVTVCSLKCHTLTHELFEFLFPVNHFHNEKQTKDVLKVGDQTAMSLSMLS